MKEYSKVSPYDVQTLEEKQANEIYRALYWNPLCLGRIKSQAIANAIMSMGVNFGIKAAATSAQRAFGVVGGVGIIVDGSMGEITARAINSVNDERFLFEYFKDCQRRYIDICVKNPTQVVFLRGWMNRVNSILEGVIDG